MNFLEIFNSFPLPGQHACEWRGFLIFVQGYFKALGVANPFVVELGVKTNKQKPFYEKLLGGTHIGIDYDTRYIVPDIFGDSQKVETRDALINKLNGRKIDLLFIDANHKYDFVKRDYELYGPLVRHLVVLHDINHPGPGKLWQELNMERLFNRTFVSFSNTSATKNFPAKEVLMGIGIIILEEKIL